MKESELERHMQALGVERYRSKVDQMVRQRAGVHTKPARHLLREATPRILNDIRQRSKRLRNDPSAGMKAEIIAAIVCREILNQITEIRPRSTVAYAIARRIEDEARMRAFRDQHRGLWKYVERTMGRRGYKKLREEVRYQGKVVSLDFQEWDYVSKCKLGLLLLDIFQHRTGLVEYEKRRRGKREIILVAPAKSAIDWIERAHKFHERLTPFYLPTVIPPAKWLNGYSGGYHTNEVCRFPVIKSKPGDQATAANEAMVESQLERPLAAINTLQMTPWEINCDVFETFSHFWGIGSMVGGLPGREDMPIPRPFIDYDPNAQEGIEWRRKRRRLKDANISNRSKRLQILRTLRVAEAYERGSRFFYPMSMDFRGRIYPLVSFLQPQGPDYARGLIRFAEGKPIETDEHARWLAIHGANCYGMDKHVFAEREQWVRSHAEEIFEVYRDPIECRWWADADKPWQFLAFCLEWGAFLEQGFGFVSRLPIAMDASASGLQIFSMLLGDESGARATNVLPTQRPSDIYQVVADRATAALKASSDPMAAQWLEFVDGRLPRAATKRCVMVVPYSGTRHAMLSYVADWYRDHRERKGWITPFGGEAFKECWFLVKFIFDAIDETIVSAGQCLDWLKAVSNLATKENKHLHWTTPLGLVVKQRYSARDIKQIKSAYSKHTAAFYIDRPERVSGMRSRNALSPNFIHSLDAAALMAVVIRCREAGIVSYSMVHDSYATTAADTSTMMRITREVFCDIFSRDVLANFRAEIQKQIDADLPPLPARGDLDLEELKKSPYFFS